MLTLRHLFLQEIKRCLIIFSVKKIQKPCGKSKSYMFTSMNYQGRLLFLKYIFYLLTLSLVNNIGFHFCPPVFQEIYISDYHFKLKRIIIFCSDNLETQTFFIDVLCIYFIFLFVQNCQYHFLKQVLVIQKTCSKGKNLIQQKFVHHEVYLVFCKLLTGFKENPKILLYNLCSIASGSMKNQNLENQNYPRKNNVVID